MPWANGSNADVGVGPPPPFAQSVDFVLAQYVQQGVEQLDEGNLSGLLKLKYGGVSDAIAALGDAGQVRQMFVGMQHHLYAPAPIR